MLRPTLLLLTVMLVACERSVARPSPVFVEGRAVAPAGDSLYGIAAPSGPLLLMGGNGVVDTLGVGVLRDPVTVQFTLDRWWVSDIASGQPGVVRLGGTDTLRLSLGPDAAQPHEFAILPDGGLVYETRDQRLVVQRGDSTTTFAVVQVGDRPSLVVGAVGGVLHAVPGRHVSLYNAFGNVRWRIEWPWVETAHISAIAVDARSRIHVLSGVADEGTFIVYTIESTNGEVTRWSVPDSNATFVVDRLGEVTSDTRGRWRR